MNAWLQRYYLSGRNTRRSLPSLQARTFHPTHCGCCLIILSSARVLGSTVLGDNCRVGANSVVLSDLPPGCLAVGVPARVILGC